MIELMKSALTHAEKAVALRAESAKYADAAEFHAAVSRAYLRDIAAAHAGPDEDDAA